MGGFVGQLVEVGDHLLLASKNQTSDILSEAEETVMELLLTERKDLSPTMARLWPNGCGIVNRATKAE